MRKRRRENPVCSTRAQPAGLSDHTTARYITLNSTRHFATPRRATSRASGARYKSKQVSELLCPQPERLARRRSHLGVMAPHQTRLACVVVAVFLGRRAGAFVLGPGSRTREDARDYCLANGMDLASIHSEAENQLAWDVCTSSGANRCWIGGEYTGGTSWA